MREITKIMQIEMKQLEGEADDMRENGGMTASMS